MEKQISVFMLLLITRGVVRSVQVRMSAKEPASEGSDVKLSCLFDLDEEKIFSVKWYKGDKQFYRYMPSSEHPYLLSYVEGINVNVSRSSPHEVTLTGITKAADGLYRCEVIGETPHFAKSSAEKYIQVHLIPENGPFINGAQDEYIVGHIVDLNCTSEPSRPQTNLTWWINDSKADDSQLYGPFSRRIEELDATSTALRLIFRLDPERFFNTQLTLVCESNIDDFYQSRAIHRARVRQIEPSQMFNEGDVLSYTEGSTDLDEGSEYGPDDASSCSSSACLVIVLLIYTILRI